MASSASTVSCPICSNSVRQANINNHIDSNCNSFIEQFTPAFTQVGNEKRSKQPSPPSTQVVSEKRTKASFFTSTPSRHATSTHSLVLEEEQQLDHNGTTDSVDALLHDKRKRPEEESQEKGRPTLNTAKRVKTQHAPLAERMRPSSLDEVAGQELVGRDGVLRNLIVTNRVPSMILWGGPGTGKTTIARLLAESAGTRFIEINSTSSGVGECKRLFDEAKNEMKLTGRKTIIFCDEIHRFSKSQQDVFLAPVEAGQIILVGATTENPSFKIVNALLSRCRTFTLSKLTGEDILVILRRALQREMPELPTPSSDPTQANDGISVSSQVSDSKPTSTKAMDSSPRPTQVTVKDSHTSQVVDSTSNSTQANDNKSQESKHLLVDNDFELLRYLADFADGDARTALNLLELALDLSRKPDSTGDSIKKSLTQTLVYDRAGDQHYDTISAFHKSVRGSDPDATLYYLARMLQSGEDPLYIARRMVVIASEDVGLADNSMLSLATATYSAAEKIGMPECRINLAHCAVALALAPKSVRAYRGLHAAYSALKQPGIAGLPIPVHLRNAPTRLMKELGYGKEYKYNPDYVLGQVAQEYLPDKLRNEHFLGMRDLGEQVDPDLQERSIQSAEPSHEVLLGPDGD